MDEKIEKSKKRVNQKTVDMVLIAMFAVIIAVCSWVSIPIGYILKKWTRKSE